jgi:perosamine synthetase
MIGKEERDAVMRVMERGVLSGYRGSFGPWFYGGEEVKALEKEWAERFGVKHAVACNSATSGLWMACAAADLYEHWDVIVSPYSMTCSASMPLNFDAYPVFADIEPDYYCLDIESIKSKVMDSTKAIIIVDLFGMPYDADALSLWAWERGITVIEDAAQAIGSTYKGRYAGTLGDMGVYSLNVHKHIQCGEGGMVVTNSDYLAQRLRLAMNHGEAAENDIPMPHHNIAGMNMRMTELSAAIAREQLKKLDSIIKVYQDNAKDFDIPIRPGCTSSYYKYATMNPVNPNPDKYNFKQHYITPILRMPLFKHLGYDPDECPVCDEVESKISLSWLREVV